jgi:hypothetical protein
MSKRCNNRESENKNNNQNISQKHGFAVGEVV